MGDEPMHAIDEDEWPASNEYKIILFEYFHAWNSISWIFSRDTGGNLRNGMEDHTAGKRTIGKHHAETPYCASEGGGELHYFTR